MHKWIHPLWRLREHACGNSAPSIHACVMCSTSPSDYVREYTRTCHRYMLERKSRNSTSASRCGAAASSHLVCAYRAALPDWVIDQPSRWLQARGCLLYTVSHFTSHHPDRGRYWFLRRSIQDVNARVGPGRGRYEDILSLEAFRVEARLEFIRRSAPSFLDRGNNDHLVTIRFI